MINNKVTNKSEYLKTNSISIHHCINFLDQNETEDQKPLNFLNIRETEKLEEQEDLSYQHDTFKNDDVSLSKLATESKVNEKINFDFTITNAALDPFSNKNNNLTDDSKINVEKDII